MAAVEVGFPAVSRWIAADDDGEAFVIRKFDRLAARNLLYLQARMLALQGRLAQWGVPIQEEQGPKVPMETREKMKKHIDLHEELRKTIKEYR
ncbi:uncharacterized protein PgNI_08498 [Pyricularia grisea]|uniref:DUF6594 domain-containing protein n=1 Tax=Pyricularia grisea TaxID=148305 RepID=A0A6P8AVM8_PYRGI|nr:uncharacterized protein PgNI_08498 [Pyricularia grisea]TLD06255.1 hypothetical protein PgNI_08498 [Pyricularia grisea]